MKEKRKICLPVECIMMFIGILSFFKALPINKLSILWLLVVFCGAVLIFISVSFEKNRYLKNICFIVGFFLFISFPLTYHIDKFVNERKANNSKYVETLIIPSEFTPIKKGKIYDFMEESKEDSIIFFTRENKKSKEFENLIIKVKKRQNDVRVYYYNMDKMPEREVLVTRKFLTHGKEPILVKISEGEVIEKITYSDSDKIKNILKEM